VIEPDGHQRGLGDCFGAGEDGVDGDVADQMRQAADHAAGPFVEQIGVPEQLSRLEPMQSSGLFEGGDQCPSSTAVVLPNGGW
jgi:hypothetical protein